MSSNIPIHHGSDSRLDRYRGLTDRKISRQEASFVCEGRWLVERLIEADYDIESVLMTTGTTPLSGLPSGVPVYEANLALIQQVVGYKYHRGMLAVARRRPLMTIEVMSEKMPERALVVMLVDVCDAENVGAIIRSAAALGVWGVVLAGATHDPFYRRALRASMGATFGMRLAKVPLPDEALARLHGAGFQTIAAVASDSAEDLGQTTLKPRRAIVLGSEGEGLDPKVAADCSNQVTIPMSGKVDSLNVAAAAAILIYEMRDMTDVH